MNPITRRNILEPLRDVLDLLTKGFGENIQNNKVGDSIFDQGVPDGFSQLEGLLQELGNCLGSAHSRAVTGSVTATGEKVPWDRCYEKKISRDLIQKKL